MNGRIDVADAPGHGIVLREGLESRDDAIVRVSK